MSWTAPRTWTAGEIVTASIMNSAVRDNLRYLKGLDGTVTLSDGLDLGANELTINSLEIIGTDGEVNKTVVEDHTHADAANCGTIDHGALTGLTDDDHTQYQKENLFTTAGDIAYATAASTWARLGIGTAGQILRTNAGATAPEWHTGVATREFFIPSGAAYTAQTLENEGDFAVVSLTAAGHCLYFSFKCPHDFTTLTHCKIIGIKTTTANIDWTATTDFATIGEACTTHSDSDTADDLAMTDTEIEEVDISAAFTGLAADDYVGCKFLLDAIDDGQYKVIGLVFKYT